jgi:predicted amidohydrolase YtcJ
MNTCWSRRGAFVETAPILLVTLLAACTRSAGAPIDSIYYNGKVATVDDQFTIAEAVAVRDGRIVAVGSNRNVRHLATRGTKQLDLGGRTVLPGFYDSHVHLNIGDPPEVHDWTNLQTFADLAAALREQARTLPKGTWIQGRLKNESFPEQRLPHRRDLDSLTPDHPVVLTRGAHVMILNSLGIRRAGITRASRPAPGGSIDLDANGEPTGILREGAAWRLVWPHVPQSPVDPASARVALRHTLDQLPALGVTSISVPGMRPKELRFIQDLYAHEGDSLVRATVQLRLWPGYDEYDDLGVAVRESIREMEGLSFHSGFGNERLKLGAIKLSIDGGLTGQGFWSTQPYPGRPNFRGTIRIPESALYPVVKRGHELGWQFGIHAIGDAAVDMTVRVLERVYEETGRGEQRDYLHHVSVRPSDATLDKMAELGIAVSSQPNFSYALSPYAVSALTGERLQTNNPQQSLLRHGIRVGYGSDNMPLGPLVGIYAAVTRKGVDGKVYGPDERVTVEEAIRAYTMGTAYLTNDENNRGSLEPGKLADMVVLDQDILAASPDQIKDIPVYMTVVGDKVLYRRTQ